MDNYPIINLAGSEDWLSGYELSKKLEELYPNEEALDFAYCVQYTDHPDLSSGIKFLKCLQVGERDEGDWIWQVELGDGTWYVVTGWCDYTGWDCQSDSRWASK